MLSNARPFVTVVAVVSVTALPTNWPTVFAPSVYNLYGGTTYTPITDAIFVYKQSSPLSEELKNDIAKQISITAYSIYSAASILRDPLDFQRYYDL